MTSTLVIIPCGRAKIWDKSPNAGPISAAHAYIGAPFTVNRRYAEASGSEWVILSAKYGFLHPTDLVPGPYEVTFKRLASNPVGVPVLQDQVRQMQLDRYAEVVGLGGKVNAEADPWLPVGQEAGHSVVQGRRRRADDLLRGRSSALGLDGRERLRVLD